ncbi:hypothetical protein JG688_00010212 [Phytophthora aleatoria]|uniref:PiggyBac transposable element-derived protein 4 C-terminal zinc-ribbon domain-containing protein n=1 Tax=Phytophthora aleatoria TaxID=2496075 RepID=A0A8J5IQK5_9STRA|nr:hypothetical protein JG688_00010212 [Phytophthora aleatoria]
MVVRHETRSEKIAFAERLTQVHVGDRIRLLQEHRAFIRGERPTDTDFSSARPASSGPLRNQARPRPIARQSAEVEELDDDDDEEDEEEDEEENESWGAEDELESATGKGKAKAKRVVKSKKVVGSAAGAKPRKKSAATLAKEARVAAAAAKCSAAAKARQDQASDAQKKRKEAKKAARKRLEEAKGKKRMADTEAPAEPKKRRTFPHETTQGGCDSSTESPSPDRSTADQHIAQLRSLHKLTLHKRRQGMYNMIASIVQPLVGPVPAADEESGDALDSECDEEEEEMMFDYRPPPDDEGEPIPRSLPADHVPRENPDYQIVNGQRKRRQRQCKVCSNRKRSVGERRATKYYCPGCSLSDKARTYLCNKVWPHTKNNTLTCHQIWHFQWNNGANRPRPRCGRDIQRREAGSGAGKRKRHRRSLSGQDNDNAAEATEREDTAEEEAAEDTAADEHADEE